MTSSILGPASVVAGAQPDATPTWAVADPAGGAELTAAMDMLTLRFTPALEAEYARDLHHRTLTQMRIAMLGGVALYALFGLLDVWLAPNQLQLTWFMRFGIVVPAGLTALAITGRPVFLAHRDLIVAFPTVLGALGVIAMTAIIPPPGQYLYYAGLFLLFMYFCTFCPLQFPWAVGMSFFCVVAYTATAWIVATAPPKILFSNVFFLITGSLLSVLANYAQEYRSRRNFVQRRVIQGKTAELESKNEQLMAANRELERSRLEILRSMERTNVMFSALTEALPGTILDQKYSLEEPIGSGGFGTVYRGKHLLLNRPIAIKVLRPNGRAITPDDVDRFRAEAMASLRVNHPNAVVVHDFAVSSSGIAYLVMELLQGHSLADELRQNKQLPLSRCVDVLVPVCEALAEAHRVGLVHRDIKPSNIFVHQVNTGETVKVIDFGIAKLVERPPDSQPSEWQRATATDLVVGSPAYMAPERVRNDPYDGRADVYAVGVTLFEMVSGRLPFESAGRGYAQLAMMHMTQEPPTLTSLRADVPAELDDLVSRALGKDPSLRPTASEFAVELATVRTQTLEAQNTVGSSV